MDLICDGLKLIQVLPSTLRHAVKVQVPYFEFDAGLKAYFKKTETFLAEDQVGFAGSTLSQCSFRTKAARQGTWWSSHSWRGARRK